MPQVRESNQFTRLKGRKMGILKFTSRFMLVAVALGIATTAESDHHEQMGPEMTPEQVIQTLPAALQAAAVTTRPASRIDSSSA